VRLSLAKYVASQKGEKSDCRSNDWIQKDYKKSGKSLRIRLMWDKIGGQSWNSPNPVMDLLYLKSRGIFLAKRAAVKFSKRLILLNSCSNLQ
jgi:hypothetical protein